MKYDIILILLLFLILVLFWNNFLIKNQVNYKNKKEKEKEKKADQSDLMMDRIRLIILWSV